ncbi:thermonuclease family protein [Salinicoccus sp. HZC-1]|uniref:thermonuclease family protein n=1 Tax=Salinicoccus sp. HZC-1 TaxID=3385497 RepID=UPI00398B585D
MGTFVGILIFFAIAATLTFFVLGLIKRFEGKSYNQIWNFSLYSFAATCALFILLSVVSSGFMLFDLALALWILLTIAMFVFLVLGIVFRKNESSRNKHFIRTGSFFIAGLVCFFVLLFSSTDVDSTSDQIAADGAEAVEEETEEPTEETTTEAEKEAAEKKAEEEKVAKEAAEKEKEESIEAEKEKEESIEEEKSLEAEKAKEESIEEAKKEEEVSIEEEKKKEESIEAEKAKEEKAAEKEKEEAKEEKVAAKEGLIPVNLYRVTDGDTVNVLDNNGDTLKLRLLLIDTPETVHPNKPVEPYGKEASARLTQLLNNADQLYIEYDSGDKTDHYDRELVYLYADDVNVHEVLLKEGLARVGYIYEQQRYLSEFRAAEQYAKDRQLGIWSIPGYVNEGGEGFNSEEPEPEPEPTDEPATSEPATTEQPAQQEFFENCTDLRGTYPEGVPQGDPAYQPKMDRDKDGWACEVS